MSSKTTNPIWTFAIVSIALFMVVLDNLVVTMALPAIRTDLGGSIESLEWTVNAFTLTFAVFLLIGAALGDRYGRKRMFVVGLAIFTAASASAALSPSLDVLVISRAIQGLGAAIVLPLTLTLLSEAVPAGKRGLAIGAWAGISGLAVALGPVVGGVVTEGMSWNWIFWLNVPIGLVLAPMAIGRLSESRGPSTRLDVVGVVLVGLGLFGLTFGIVRAQSLGWTSDLVIGSIAVGAVLLIAFLRWEARTTDAMLPLRLFKSRGFSATNGLSFAMYFGMFGSIFLVAQTFQIAQGYSPLEAGIRTLPWTAMPMFVAPIAGLLSDRIGPRPLLVAGMTFQAVSLYWMSTVISPTTPYGELVIPFILGGTGLALVFAPSANSILSSVRASEAGQASGALNAIREVGGVLGVAVLASVFTAHGSYASPDAFTDGVTTALPIGAAVVGAGALVALLVPGRNRAPERASEGALAEAAA